MLVALPATNGVRFYQAQESAPNRTQRFVGLVESSLDTASICPSGSQITISGLRVQSADYNFNDYVTAKYNFDPVTQGFAPVNINVMTNVGVTCGTSQRFFMKDSTKSIVMTDGTFNYQEWNCYDITSTGQVFYADLDTAQVLSMITKPAVDDFRVTVSDPDGNKIMCYEVAACVTYYHDGVRAFRPGRYSWKFESLTNPTLSISFSFINGNGSLMTAVGDGDYIWCSIEDYYADYAKYRVALNSGNVLRLDAPGEGASIALFDSKGVTVSSFSGTGNYIYVASKTDTYYLVYYHDDFYSHDYLSMVIIDASPTALTAGKSNLIKSSALGTGAKASGGHRSTMP